MYKHQLQWASIGQREQYGIVGLLLVLIVAVGVRVYVTEAATNKAIQVSSKPKQSHNDSSRTMSIININTADSEALCALRGVGGKSAHRLLAARRKKRFTHAYEVLEYLRIKERDWRELRRRIRFR